MLFKFLGYQIIQEEIVGVGPLMSETYPDMATRQVYLPKKIFFMLFLKSSSIKIESDWIKLSGDSVEKNEENRKVYQTSVDQFTMAISEISQLISKEKKVIRELIPPPDGPTR